MNPDLGTALLVGGSSQLGFAVLTELLGPSPRRVVLAGRPSEGLWRHADQLRDAGYQVSTAQYDASHEAAGTDGLLEHLTADHQLGLVVIAVGALSADSFADALVVNGLAVAVLVQTLIGRMSDAGSGQLVLLSSAAAARPRRSVMAYSLGKQLADSTALLLAPQAAAAGVRVLVVRPGFVATRMTEGLDRPPLWTTPAKVASQVARAIAGHRVVVWVPRSMALVVRVLRWLPSALIPAGLR
ncbi:decaprenylphospho-beta-D-erythro-pentofuranosid-2-ulose 2-reductase [Kribbella voronezhensis]|uniref:Decaprenylphospho-beta-D-erythro-pentofuranosid-2-ulose 2-reductase n=1 Tax=Kribbella voronezhensis TaxID=2512212 RepID=A0A4R7SWI3_9ACTN|nr:SDR family NAD(P)-dependent oxidoreductase [Kribbella voronezhensis]TDU83594.1 decaprenylphospho-beta-D-erythro-pentofuranosid-2-ulose 2-reductase [Kribbella voronezhensis]